MNYALRMRCAQALGNGRSQFRYFAPRERAEAEAVAHRLTIEQLSDRVVNTAFHANVIENQAQIRGTGLGLTLSQGAAEAMGGPVCASRVNPVIRVANAALRRSVMIGIRRPDDHPVLSDLGL
jgi:hypothetical protein